MWDLPALKHDKDSSGLCLCDEWGWECFVLTYTIFKFIVKKLIPNMPLIIPQHKKYYINLWLYLLCIWVSFFFLFCKFMKLRASMQEGGGSLKWCKAWISCQTPGDQTDVWLKIIFIELEHISFIYMKVYNVDTLGSAQVVTDWVIYLNLFKLKLIYLNKFIN